MIQPPEKHSHPVINISSIVINTLRYFLSREIDDNAILFFNYGVVAESAVGRRVWVDLATRGGGRLVVRTRKYFGP